MKTGTRDLSYIRNTYLSDFADYLAYFSSQSKYVTSIGKLLKVSETELMVLLYVKNKEHGSVRSDIARFYNIKPSNISRTVSRLIARKLIYENDKILFLTAEGNSTLQNFHDVIIACQPSERPFDNYMKLRLN